MNRKKEVLRSTLKKGRAGIVAVCLSLTVSAVVFRLYRLPLEPFVYAAVLICVLGLVILAVSYVGELKKADAREKMKQSALTDCVLPPAQTLAERDYQEMIALLSAELTRLRNEFEERRQDELDYYTTWVHQIKTPIAVMRMELGDGDTELRQELFRIEQYVDMVLQYIRLGDGSSDLVIREYPLDELIRGAVRKFAPQFVAKRLGLCYEGTDAVIVTDKKWFSCILEQILSNAIKYTPAGCITISPEGELLRISDTGIGIAAEDIPRIFDKGFTGENGRIDKRASGLGLYLCKRAATLQRIPLAAESTVGKGTTLTLDLTGKLKVKK